MMKFEILGGGCANCDKLEALTREVVQELGVAGAEIGHVTDYAEIMRYGVMSTPALAIDGKVVVAGKVPSKADLTSIVTSAMS
jgi:small redox-active disulfide protein 2